MRWLILVALGLASCASLSDDACRRGNWAGIGLADGAAGRPKSYLGRHIEACGPLGIVPEVAEWQAGRQRGLALYCTPRNAYEVGRRGGRLAPVCDDETRALVAANLQGQALHEIERRIDRLRDENRDLDLRIAALRGGERTDEKRRLIRAWRAEQQWNALDAQMLALERLRYGRP